MIETSLPNVVDHIVKKVTGVMIHTLKTMYAEKWKVIKMKKLMGRVAEPVFLYQF